MNNPSSYCKCITVSMFNIQWIFYFSKCTLSYTYAWHLIVEATFHKKHSIEYTGNCNPFTSLRKCCTATARNVLHSHLNGECTLSERWAHSEWTVSTRWTQFGERLWSVNSEWTQSTNGLQMWVQSEWLNASWMICEHYLNARWSIYSECLIVFCR